MSVEREVPIPPRRDSLLPAVKFKPEVAAGRAELVLRELRERIREVMGMRFGGEIELHRDETLPDTRPPQDAPPGSTQGPLPPRRPLPWS